MDNELAKSAEVVSMFCRLQMNRKRDIPIRPSEMGVLIYTEKQGGPVTPLMISQFFKIAKPSVTAMVNSLIKNDYLIKIPSSTDGRSYSLKISDKGRILVESTFEEYFKSMELLMEKMGKDEFSTFVKLIEKANTILSEVKK